MSNNSSRAKSLEDSKGSEIIEESIVNQSKSYCFPSPATSGKGAKWSMQNSAEYSEKITTIKKKLMEIFGRERHQEILAVLNQNAPQAEKVL